MKKVILVSRNKLKTHLRWYFSIFSNTMPSKSLWSIEFPVSSVSKGEITHSIESVPKVSHLWGKMDFLLNWT